MQMQIQIDGLASPPRKNGLLLYVYFVVQIKKSKCDLVEPQCIEDTRQCCATDGATKYGALTLPYFNCQGPNAKRI